MESGNQVWKREPESYIFWFEIGYRIWRTELDNSREYFCNLLLKVRFSQQLSRILNFLNVHRISFNFWHLLKKIAFCHFADGCCLHLYPYVCECFTVLSSLVPDRDNAIRKGKKYCFSRYSLIKIVKKKSDFFQFPLTLGKHYSIGIG